MSAGGQRIPQRGGHNVTAAVKTHCYMRSGGLILAQGSVRVPKAVYDLGDVGNDGKEVPKDEED